MQRTWGQYPSPDFTQRQQPAARFTEDEITAFIEEVSAARDREAFNKLTARFDAQFLAKHKARFPNQTGKFPFGSAGKPYTYGTAPSYQPQQTYPPPSVYQPGYDRPQSAMMGRSMPDPLSYSQYPMDQGYQAPQYQVRTPSPQRNPGFSQRFEAPYGAPMYDRGGYQPDYKVPSAYVVDRQFGDRPTDPQYSQSGARFQDVSAPNIRQPTPGKSAPANMSDFAELRKMKEEMLARFQVSTPGQRPPRG